MKTLSPLCIQHFTDFHAKFTHVYEQNIVIIILRHSKREYLRKVPAVISRTTGILRSSEWILVDFVSNSKRKEKTINRPFDKTFSLNFSL